MISASRLLCNGVGPGDHLRYGSGDDHSPVSASRPIVVWNYTRRCNLNCIHCYSNSDTAAADNEMSIDDGKTFIRQLADFGVPVILFSGGEPLMRPDFFELAGYAAGCGLGVVLSTNGTLLTEEKAAKIRDIGFREVGISLDGIGKKNDLFRGKEGAYEAAMDGIRNCISAGQRVSLRMTLTRSNHYEVSTMLDLVEREKIDRVCFYHLAYAGRGDDLRDIDLSHEETREVVDLICERTLDFYSRGLRKEVLLVGNHADGVHIYLKLKQQDPAHAKEVLSLLRRNGGNNSGIRIAAVDEAGDVHPDQFWRSVTLGNVRERDFGHIWMDTSNPVLAGLRDRQSLLKGRCARCAYLDMCNGNLRERAEATFGDMWQEDPACYLTNQEIGVAGR
jgi:radical SAM protein with 4Fe4S-binding SPASM domain